MFSSYLSYIDSFLFTVYDKLKNRSDNETFLPR